MSTTDFGAGVGAQRRENLRRGEHEYLWLVFSVESGEPKFHGLFNTKHAVDEVANKIVGDPSGGTSLGARAKAASAVLSLPPCSATARLTAILRREFRLCMITYEKARLVSGRLKCLSATKGI